LLLRALPPAAAKPAATKRREPPQAARKQAPEQLLLNNKILLTEDSKYANRHVNDTVGIGLLRERVVYWRYHGRISAIAMLVPA